MDKYKSATISENDIKIDTNRYWDEEEKRVDVVKLTMISTNIDVTVASYIGQLHAYNKALENLEIKYAKYRKRMILNNINIY